MAPNTILWTPAQSQDRTQIDQFKEMTVGLKLCFHVIGPFYTNAKPCNHKKWSLCYYVIFTSAVLLRLLCLNSTAHVNNLITHGSTHQTDKPVINYMSNTILELWRLHALHIAKSKGFTARENTWLADCCVSSRSLIKLPIATLKLGYCSYYIMSSSKPHIVIILEALTVLTQQQYP